MNDSTQQTQAGKKKQEGIALDQILPDHILIGERNYEQALNLVIGNAKRELLIFDQDFSKGAYSSVQSYECISNFLSGNQTAKLVIVLQHSSAFQATCPRLFGLLQLYSHRMTVFQTNEQAQSAKDSFVIADQSSYIRRFHADQARFKYSHEDMETVSMLNLRFDELLLATSHTLAISTLGL